MQTMYVVSAVVRHVGDGGLIIQIDGRTCRAVQRGRVQCTMCGTFIRWPGLRAGPHEPKIPMHVSPSYFSNLVLGTLSFERTLQSSEKTFLPGFGNGWLKYCAIVQFWSGQRNILRVVLKT